MPTRSSLLALAGLLLVIGSAAACNIPVFRYALDHWAADPYRITVYHRGPLDAAAREKLQILERHADRDHPPIVIELVDLAVTPEGVKDVPLPPGGAVLPWIVARYPTVSRIPASVWAGPLGELTPAALLDSPARREIAKRIRSGESAVWLLLACGDTARDDATERLLRAELSRLEKELKIPKRTSAPEDQLVDEAGRPLRLAFSVLRVNRADPQERALVQMLLNTEDDLPGRADPMVFPVFGRGRALPALVGAGITADNISDSAAFLVGPCSCQVKRDNPGVDLLVTADWGSAVSASPEPVGLPAVPAGSPVPIPAPPVESTPTPRNQPAAVPTPTTWLRYALFAGIGTASLVVVVTGVLLLRARRTVGP